MSNARVTLAQELHDGIAQDLVGLGFSIDAVIASCNEPITKEELRRIRFKISEAIEKVRVELHALRTPDLSIEDSIKPELIHQIERVFSEILRNVHEHSQATSLTIEVNDNGVGGAQEKQGHFGLLGILERIRNINGDITIESNNLGTRIGIEIPLDR
jgi:signal transduction histidine kinase